MCSNDTDRKGRRMQAAARLLIHAAAAGILLLTGGSLAAAAQGADKAPAQPPAEPAPAAPRGAAPGLRRQADAKTTLVAGDQVAIYVSRPAGLDCEGVIETNGLLFLKVFNHPIRAAGLTVAQLQDAIASDLEVSHKLRARPTVNVVPTLRAETMGRIPVTGSVVSPGPQMLEPELRVWRYIEFAGGPNKDADLKRVTVHRRDNTARIVDLSSAEQLRDPSHNFVLLDGDSVVVPERAKQTVTLDGAVARRGPQEIQPNQRLYKLLEIAGGVDKDADLTRVRVTHDDEKLTSVVVDISDADRRANPSLNIVLRDGDSIFIPSRFKTGFVAIKGAVSNEGTYELRPGMSLEDLLAQGKLLVSADFTRMELKRENSPLRKINLEEQASKGVEGRILLEPGDLLHVPTWQNAVLVAGPVPNPGPRRLIAGQTIADFVRTSLGGKTGRESGDAILDASRIDIRHVEVYRDGEKPLKVDLKVVMAEPRRKENLVLKPGDLIYLPAKDSEGKKKIGPLDYFGPLGSLGYLFTVF
jgi:polysaccharide export outer membrane protein